MWTKDCIVLMIVDSLSTIMKCQDEDFLVKHICCVAFVDNEELMKVCRGSRKLICALILNVWCFCKFQKAYSGIGVYSSRLYYIV